MAHLSITQILRSVVATFCTLLAGLGLVVLGVALAVILAPGGTDDLRAYEAAARCPAVPTAPAKCRWTQEFTVSGVRLTHSRGKSNRAFLTSADGARWETLYSSDGPVLDGLHDGDRVTGTIWRGLLTEIAADGVTQVTEDAPADMRARVLIAALITVPSGLVMAAACAWRLGRRAAPDPMPGMVATLSLAFGLLLAGLCSPVLLGSRGETFWLVAAVWLPIAAILTAVARGYTTHQRTPDAVTG